MSDRSHDKRSPEANQGDSEKKQKGRRPSLKPDVLEPRILLSATWVDADTGDAQAGATEGNDVGAGDGADDTIYGLGGDDQLFGGGGNDSLFGGEGNDLLRGGEGDDTLDGGADHDTVDLSDATAGVSIDITLDGQAQDLGSLGTDTLDSIEGVVGSGHDDTFAFTQPVNGSTYTVDGGGGTNNQINLSGYSSGEATVTSDSITVDSGGVSFTIDYQNIHAIAFSDGSVTPPEGNEAPTDLSFVGTSVTENSTAGTVVGTATATDPDSGETFTYALTDDAGGRFEIDADTGVITVAAGADLDFESQTSHNLTVEVTDSAGNTYEEGLPIQVTDIPTVTVTGNATLSAADGPFDDLVLNASTVTIDGELEVSGNLTITSLYRLNDGDINVAGDVTTLDTSFSGTGRLVLDGAGDQTVSAGGGTGEIYNLSVEKSAGTVTISDHLQISGSYTDNGTTVDATGATVELEGNPTVSAGATTFGDVELDASTVTVDGTMDVNGNLTITSLYRLNDGDVNVAGDVTTLDTSFSGTGRLVLDGDGAQTVSAGGGTGEIYNLSIEKSAGTVTISDHLQISGSYTDNGTTVDATGATVELEGNPTVSAGATMFGDVELDASTVTVDGTMDVNGNLTITSLYRLNDGDINVAGDVTTLDTSFSGTGRLVLDGDGAQTVSAGGGTGEVYNLSIEKSAGSVTINDHLQISGSYADNGTAVDASGATVELEGNPTVSAGATTFGDLELDASTITVDGELDVNGDLTITKLYRLNDGDINVAGDLTTLDTSFSGTGRVVLDGDGAQTVSAGGGTGEVYNLSIEKSGGSVTINDHLQISGSYADNGTAVDATGATVGLEGNATVSAGATTFGDLELNASTITVDGELDVNGDLTITKLYRLNDGDVNVAGDVTTLDTSFSGTGRVVLDGVGDQTVSAGGGTGEIYNLSVEKSAGGVTINDHLQISGSYDDNGTAVDATAAKVEFEGNPTVSAGATTFGDVELDASTVTLDGNMWVTGDLTVTSLYRLENGTIYVAGEIDLADSSWSGDGQIVSWDNQPTDIDFDGTSVAENAPAGTIVGTASTTDPDPGDTFAYELTNDADGRFEIDRDTGVLTVADGADLNYELSSSHSVAVKVTDSTGNEYTESFDIQVQDVLDGELLLHHTSSPFATTELDLQIDSVLTGDPAAESATVTVSDLPDGASLTAGVENPDGTWTLTLAEANAAKLVVPAGYEGNVDLTVTLSEEHLGDTTSGTLTTSNYNSSGTGFQVTARTIQSDGTLSDESVSNVKVTGSGLGVIGSTGASAPSYQLGYDAGHEVSEEMIVRFDELVDTSTVTVKALWASEGPSSGGEVGHWAAYRNGELVAESDFTTNSGSYDAVVTIEAPGGYDQLVFTASTYGSGQQGVTSNSSDYYIKRIDFDQTERTTVDTNAQLYVDVTLNSAPTLSIGAGTVAEDASEGTVAAVVTPSDPDAGETFTYELTDDADGRFAIDDDGNITLVGGVDFESADSHDVTVEVTDSVGNTVTETVSIAVTDVNEASSDLAFDGTSVAENAAGGTVVGTASTVDPDAGETFTYELTDDADGRFEIDPSTGLVTVADGADLNHEDTDSHTLTVKVTDSGGHETTESFDVAVTDVNEEIDSLHFVTIDGSLIFDTEPLSYGFENDPIGSSLSTLDFGSGVTAAITQVDGRVNQIFEGTDGYGAVAGEGDRFWKIAGGQTTLDFSRPLTEISFRVSDVEWGQVTVSSGGEEIPLPTGNANSSDIVTITAPEGQTFDSVRFTWNNASGQNDGVGLDAFVVTQAPSEAVAVVAENAAAGTAVGSAAASDPDEGETFEYRLTDDAGGRFVINGDGTVRVADGAELDFEDQSSFEVTVEVEDSAGHVRSLVVPIEVTDVNESPVEILLSGTSVPENSEAGVVVADLTVEDPDFGDSHTFEIVGGGSQRLEDALADDPDGQHSVEYLGSDSGKKSSGMRIVSHGVVDDGDGTDDSVWRVRNSNDEPRTVTVRMLGGETRTLTVEANTETYIQMEGTGTFVLEHEGTRLQASGTNKAEFSSDLVVDGPNPNFTIEDGRLVVADGAELDHEGEPTQAVVIRATDEAGNVVEQEFEVMVADVLEWSVDAGEDVAVDEGASVTLSARWQSDSTLDFEGVTVESHGGSSQDRGVDVAVDGDALSMTGNGWKSVDYPVTVTEDTVLEFQFRSYAEGEIHGIGFDTDGGLSENRLFKLGGTQDWGIDAYDNYPGDGEWVTYRIRVGDHFTGDFDRLVFANDHDVSGADANSQFRGIKVYDAGAETPVEGVTYQWEQVSGPTVVLDDPTAADLSFDAPSVADDSELVFRVTATHGDSVVTDEVVVHVNDITDLWSVDAGSDLAVNEGDSVTLGASVGTAEPIDFEGVTVESHGGSSQDRGVDVAVDGDALSMTGNGWKSVDYPVTVTEDTVLEFQFRSYAEGEIHGIGFDTDGGLSENRLFKLGGTQDWGIDAYDNYPGDGEWVTYRIRVGDHFTGDFDRLVFANDHDVSGADANSQFRGIKVYDAGAETPVEGVTYQWEQVSGPTVVLDDASAAAPTFDTPYITSDTEVVFRVTATVGDNVTTDEVTVRIANDNEAPTDLLCDCGSVAEGAAAGTQVGVVGVVDPDNPETHAFELIDDAGGRFQINANTGLVTVADGSGLDYEAASEHAISVRVTDSAGNERVESFVVGVTNVNEAITDMSFSGGSLTENAAPGTFVGRAAATDTDRDSTHTFALTDDAGGKFVIDPHTGVVTVAEGAVLDFEEAKDYPITILVTDEGGLTREQSFEIELIDTPDEQDPAELERDPVRTERPVYEPADSREEASAAQLDRFEEPVDDGLETPQVGFGEFVPVAEPVDLDYQEAIEWDSIEFGEVLPVHALDEPVGEADDPLFAYATPLSAGDAGATAQLEAESTGAAAAGSGLLAKLWGFARAYAGTSPTTAARHDRR